MEEKEKKMKKKDSLVEKRRVRVLTLHRLLMSLATSSYNSYMLQGRQPKGSTKGGTTASKKSVILVEERRLCRQLPSSFLNVNSSEGVADQINPYSHLYPVHLKHCP
ncbi:hypothetical protein VNO77_01871 [Canavalia gladiata]|uniref:Uncharacterized protein n=1 Tax=Canavalia gladiata TaxID=3824 RepID=A0AAN9MYE7_CANGL